MNWVTNHPKSVRGMWPRRAGVEYHEGAPQSTEAHTSEELARQGLVGVFVDMPLDQYRQLPLVKNPSEISQCSNCAHWKPSRFIEPGKNLGHCGQWAHAVKSHNETCGTFTPKKP